MNFIEKIRESFLLNKSENSFHILFFCYLKRYVTFDTVILNKIISICLENVKKTFNDSCCEKNSPMITKIKLM